MIYSISFAKGQPFEKYLKINSITAKLFGRADYVLSYTDSDIPEKYKEDHADIFKYKRGAGLWLWKPYLVNRTLDMMKDGDWLFYSDAGCFFIHSIKRIIRYAEKKNLSIVLFGLPLLNRQFCKNECYKVLGVEDRGENQAVGTFFLVKKNAESMSFMKEWLLSCERADLICPERFHNEINEFPDFYSHREDQSLLSLLAIKYKVPLNKDCSNFGQFPYDYCYKEFSYNPLKYDDCDYGVIMISHRASTPLRFLLFHIRRIILRFFRIKYTEEKVLSNRPSFANNNRNKEK